MASMKSNIERQPAQEGPQGEDKGSGTRPKGQAWLGGLILVLIGIAFLLRNLSNFQLRNWWALFILIPAISSLAHAYSLYQREGRRFASTVTGSLLGGAGLLLVALIFLFNLSWGRIWPAFLILAGIGGLLSAWRR